MIDSIYDNRLSSEKKYLKLVQETDHKTLK